MNGWTGNVLRVDLTAQTLETHDLDPTLAKDFIGGRGLNSQVLFKEVPPNCDPLSAENVY